MNILGKGRRSESMHSFFNFNIFKVKFTHIVVVRSTATANAIPSPAK